MEASATAVAPSSRKKMWGAIGLNLLLLVAVGYGAKRNYEANLKTKWNEYITKKKA